MSAELAVNITLATMNCGECGGTYAINERYRRAREEKGESWTCPYCKCGWGYSGNSENSRLKKQLEEEKARKLAALNDANQLRGELASTKKVQAQTAGKLKAMKNRVSHGVCPCCTRTFSNVARHMQTKHPEFVSEDIAKVEKSEKPPKAKSDYVKQRLAEIQK